jgi:hypothetical protein
MSFGRIFSLNGCFWNMAAVEVDLTGQVNAETASGVSVGGTGGQGDCVRGAMVAGRGHSIIALPSTVRDGAVNRIVSVLKNVPGNYASQRCRYSGNRIRRCRTARPAYRRADSANDRNQPSEFPRVIATRSTSICESDLSRSAKVEFYFALYGGLSRVFVSCALASRDKSTSLAHRRMQLTESSGLTNRREQLTG